MSTGTGAQSGSSEQGVAARRGPSGIVRAWWQPVAWVVVLVGGGLAVWKFWPRSDTPEGVEELIAAKDYGGATAMAQRLLQGQPGESRVLFLLARARAGAGDYEGMIDAARRIPDWSIRKPAAMLFAGQALRKLNRGREAERVFRQVIARDPQGQAALQARLELLALYAMEERRDAFFDLVWQTMEQLPEEERLLVLTMRLRIEFEQVKPETNAAILEGMVAADPEDADAIAGLAAARMNAGDVAEARQLYERALKLRPDDPELVERYCGVLNQEGDTSALAQALEEPGVRDAARPGLWRYRGIVAQARGDRERAVEAFTKAVELDPLDAESHHRLGQVLNQLGQREAASQHTAARTRLRSGRDQMRSAWDAFADSFDRDPGSVTAEQLDALAQGCRAAGLEREGMLLEREAQRRDPTRIGRRQGIGTEPVQKESSVSAGSASPAR